MAQTLEVMVLDGASYRLMAVHDDVVEAVPFDGVPLKLARVALSAACAWKLRPDWHILPMLEILMATRNVVLTEHQSALVDHLVTSGRYQNASEALRAGLRLLEREEAEMAALRTRLERGLEQASRGDLAEGSGEDAIRRAFRRARAAR